MKVFYAVFLLVFLASCTGANVEENSNSETDTSANTQQEQQVMDDSIDEDESSDDMMDDENEAMKTEEGEVMEGDENMEDDMADDIDEDTAMLEETASNQVMVLDATYNNPKAEVDMMINLSVDENDVIESIEVSATTYDLSDFNAAAQELLGQNISQAEEFYVAGGSLTSDAFTTAIKNR